MTVGASSTPAHFRGKRFYREWMKAQGLVGFAVCLLETDLHLAAEKDLTHEALERVVELRIDLVAYAEAHDGFYAALRPLAAEAGAPDIVRRMCRAAAAWDVGPMAAVAGAFAEMVGQRLLAKSREVIVENGGDIFIATRTPREIAIFAGEDSPFAGGLVVRVRPESLIRGVCTSSGTLGHSLSRGKADAVVAFAESATYADAAATAIGNRIHTPEDVDKTVEAEKDRGALLALVVVIGGTMGAFGDIEFVQREE